jgi:hypothetical protein
MASTYTTDLAIQLMATGENAGTWGQITNTNLVVIQQAIAGYQAISIAGGAQTTALVMTQNALANARNAVIKLTGTITGNQIVTVPNGIEKTWIVSNGTTGAFTVTFKYASTGTGQTWSTTDKGIKILYADQSDIQVTDLSTLSGTVASAQIADYAVNTAELATNAVTAIKITQSTITQAKLAANSVGANQIIQSTITQAKLAANSVGPNQLIATAVTPATYTSATITVDADGRITAASSGSGGAGGFIPTNYTVGPASGTFTAQPTANRLSVWMMGGGGGGGAPRGPNSIAGGPGGGGGWGYFNVPITQPYAQPYSVGAGGNGGGGNGVATNLGGPTGKTVNGGNAGGAANPTQGGASGNYGTAPGASLSNFPKTWMLGLAGGSADSPPFVANSGLTIQGAGGPGGDGQGAAPTQPGTPGALVIFENIGT